MRWGLLSLVTGALLCVASCARIKTQRNEAAALERDNRAEYLYKAFVLNRGFRPAKGHTGVWRTWYENGGKMSEVANLVCFLAFDRSGYIHGTVINVSGGKTRA